MAIRPRKVTAQSVQIARRAKLGQKPENQLTDADRARFAAKDAEQAERLARIAARAEAKKNNS